MNKEDYVSLEVAKMLKEKGFNEPCNGWYGINGTIFNDTYRENHNNTFPKDSRLSRPTLYEAAKWLRNEHDINVTVATAIPTWIDGISESSDTLYMPLITYKKEDGKTEMAILRNLTDSNYEKVYNDAILEALKLI